MGTSKIRRMSLAAIFFLSAVSAKESICGNSASCMFLPNKCQENAPAGNCTRVSWNTMKTGINITLHGRDVGQDGDWIAAGIQKVNGSMAGSDIYICKRLGDKMKLVSAFAGQNGPPTEYQELTGVVPDSVHYSAWTNKNGQKVFQCNFIRESTVTKNGLKFPTGAGSPYWMIEARGILRDGKWDTTYHDERTTSVNSFTFSPDEKHAIIDSL